MCFNLGKKKKGGRKNVGKKGNEEEKESQGLLVKEIDRWNKNKKEQEDQMMNTQTSLSNIPTH